MKELKLIKELKIIKEDVGVNATILGVGSGGINAIDKMIDEGLKTVKFTAIDKDLKALNESKCSKKIKIDKNVKEILTDEFKNTDLLFIVSGFGGETATEFVPEILEIAKEFGTFVVNIVTTPFDFEREDVKQRAINGINNLKKFEYTSVVIHGEKLQENLVLGKSLNAEWVFKETNNILYWCVKGILDGALRRGVVGLDFADIQNLMKNIGFSSMAVGYGKGNNKKETVKKGLIDSKSLNFNLKDVKRMYINVFGDEKFTLLEADECANLFTESIDNDAEIIFTYFCEEKLNDEIVAVVFANTKKSDRENKHGLMDIFGGVDEF